MATHLCAYTGVLPTNTLSELNVVKDDVLTQSGNTRFYIPPDRNNVIAAAALSTNLTTAYLKSPSLEVRRTRPYVIPSVVDSISFPLDRFCVHKPSRPISLSPTEELSFMAQTGANVRVYGLVWLGPATLPPAPAGDIRVVRCTGNTTLVPNEWTSVPLTPDVSLEVGTYALVGFLPISAGCIAARAIITGQVNRPGVPGVAGTESAALKLEPSYLTEIQGYLMGTFTHINLPVIQFLSSSADTSEVVYLYLVKTA
jgi:hypothetical protein